MYVIKFRTPSIFVLPGCKGTLFPAQWNGVPDGLNLAANDTNY